MNHIISLSGGISSWAAGRIVVDDFTTADDNVFLLFADTKVEDRDTYAFLEASAKDLGYPLTTIADGRDIWQVFKDAKFLGNSLADVGFLRRNTTL